MINTLIVETIVCIMSVLITRAWMEKHRTYDKNGDLMIGFHDGEVITWMTTDLSVNDLVKMDYVVLEVKDVRTNDISTYSKV